MGKRFGSLSWRALSRSSRDSCWSGSGGKTRPCIRCGLARFLEPLFCSPFSGRHDAQVCRARLRHEKLVEFDGKKWNIFRCRECAQAWRIEGMGVARHVTSGRSAILASEIRSSNLSPGFARRRVTRCLLSDMTVMVGMSHLVVGDFYLVRSPAQTMELIESRMNGRSAFHSRLDNDYNWLPWVGQKTLRIFPATGRAPRRTRRAFECDGWTGWSLAELVAGEDLTNPFW